MKFEEQYLEYDEYVELDNSLAKVPFDLLEYDVRKMIDKRTQGRLKSVKEIPYDIKMCVFKMITIKQKYQALKDQDKIIISTNTDGYTETRKKLEQSDLESEEKELMEVLENSLCGVIINNEPLLYLGVSQC